MADNFQQVIQLAFEVLGADDAQKVASTLQGVGDAGDKSNAQLGPLIDKFVDLANQSALVNKALDLSQALAQNDAALTKAKASLAALNDEFDKSDKSSVEVNLAFQQAQKAVTSLANEQLKLQTQSAATGAKLEAAGISATDLGAAHDALKTKTTEAAAALTAAASSSQKLSEQHEETGLTATELKNKLIELGAELFSLEKALELVKEALDFGAEGLKGAADIEASLSRAQALAKDAGQSFTEYGEAVEKAAQAVNVSGPQAAQALADLAQNGLSAKDAVAALIPTLQLAKIANIDNASAAQEVAQALKAFNLPATDAQHVVDLLTAASHGAAGGLGEISKAVVTLAPDAKTLGLNLDQVTGIIGLLSDKGIEGRKSLEGMRTLFQDLQNPTSALRVSLAGLGDDTSDFNTAITALNGKTPQAQAALLSVSGAARSVVEVLGQQGPGAVAKFTASLEAQSGVAAKVSDLLDQNLTGSYKKFSLAVDGIAEKLAEPILKPFADELTKLAEELNEFAESKDFGEIKDAVSDMAQKAAKALYDFVHGINWKDLIADGKDAIQQLSTAFGHLADTVKGIAAVINGTFDVFATAYHDVGTAIDGTVGIAAIGIKKLADGSVSAAQDIKTLTGVGDGLVNSLKTVSDTADDVAGIAFDNMAGHIEGAESASQDFGKQLGKLGEAASTAGAASEKGGAQFEGSGHSAKTSAADHDVLSIAITGLKKAFTDAAVEIPKFVAEIEQKSSLKAGLDNAQSLFDAASAKLKALTQNTDQYSTELAKAAQEYSATSAVLQTLQIAYNKTAEAQAALAQRTKDLESDFVQLGIVSQARLTTAATTAEESFKKIAAAQDGTEAKLVDAQNAFVAYATAALNAVKNLDAGQQAAVETQLATKAAALGLGDQLDKLEKSILGDTNAFAQYVTGAQNIAKASQDAAAAAQDLADKQFTVQNLLSKTPSQVDDIGKAAGKTATQVNDMKDQLLGAADAADNAFNVGTDHLQSYQVSLTGVGEAGVQAFAKLQDAALHSLQGLSAAGAEIGQIFSNATGALNDDIARQQQGVKDLQGYYQGLATTITATDQDTAASLQKKADALSNFSNDLKNNIGDFQLLDQASLAGLQAAVDATRARVQALADQAKAAQAQLDDMAQSAQDALDQATGNDTAVEDRRFQKQLDDLKAVATEANQLNSQTYLQAVENATKLHELNLKNLQDEADKQKANDDAQQQAQQQQAQAQRAQVQQPSQPVQVPVQVTLSVAGNAPGISNLSDSELADFAQRLAPAITPVILNAIQRAHGNAY